jgi:multicomponent Na+:H+ antiporter subunit B
MTNNNNKEPGMTLIVKTITRLTAGPVFIYGVYVVFGAHKGPGGGAAGGIIIALSLIQLMLAFGKKAVERRLNREAGLVLMSASAIIFLAVSACGYFRVFRVAGGGIRDLAAALMIGAGLFTAFSALALAAEGKKQK